MTEAGAFNLKEAEERAQCSHVHVDRDVYEYCEDCGAVRRRTKPGWPAEQWHSCPQCDIRAKGTSHVGLLIEEKRGDD